MKILFFLLLRPGYCKQVTFRSYITPFYNFKYLLQQLVILLSKSRCFYPRPKSIELRGFHTLIKIKKFCILFSLFLTSYHFQDVFLELVTVAALNSWDTISIEKHFQLIYGSFSQHLIQQQMHSIARILLDPLQSYIQSDSSTDSCKWNKISAFAGTDIRSKCLSSVALHASTRSCEIRPNVTFCYQFHSSVFFCLIKVVSFFTPHIVLFIGMWMIKFVGDSHWEVKFLSRHNSMDISMLETAGQ